MFLEPCPFCSAEFVASDPLGAETMLGHHVLIGHRSSPAGNGSPPAVDAAGKRRARWDERSARDQPGPR
jgi:hypothetical protein